MQEFIERNFYIDTEGEYQLKWTEDTLMTDEINEALEKEKQQIKNSYIIGYSDCHSSSAKNQDLYFKLLYNGKDI